MTSRIAQFISIFLFVVLFSCQDKEKQNSEVEIFPPEEKKDELREERPMSRSYLLARMRENGELSAFTEQFRKAGLEEEFEGKEGLFTIFAPSNAAYDRIPAKKINSGEESGIEENMKDDLRYYVVEGQLTVDNLLQKIRASENGRYEFRTALGEKLWATQEGDKVVLIDVLGNKAAIVTSKMEKDSGVYHVIDNVLRSGDNAAEGGS
ncbi:fasciclin domain-containing protein [Salinimicrobium soli]|uniref:fasciclin domain-containing protein n=1 Tax=Salinimicrobium soli TaxID=1254399 RepID=UPI003AB01DC3